MKKEDIIYDERFYIYKTLIHDKDFQKKIKDYKDLMANFGYPIPSKGFLNEKSFSKWITEVHKAYYVIQNSNQKYLSEKKKIAEGEYFSTAELRDALQKLEEQRLPPHPYSTPLSKILSEFFPNRKTDDHDFTFIVRYVFFNDLDYYPPLFITRLFKNKVGAPELWVQILPYTRKEHIVQHWSDIRQAQKLLPGYKERIREFKNFERDIRNLEKKNSLKVPDLHENDPYLAAQKKQKSPDDYRKIEKKYIKELGIKKRKPLTAKSIGRHSGRVAMSAGAVRTASSRINKRLKNVTHKRPPYV